MLTHVVCWFPVDDNIRVGGLITTGCSRVELRQAHIKATGGSLADQKMNPGKERTDKTQSFAETNPEGQARQSQGRGFCWRLWLANDVYNSQQTSILGSHLALVPL